MDIILSTRNPTKAIEIKTMLKEFDVNVLTLSEAGIQGEAVEDGSSLEENALKKIVFVADQMTERPWIMADDSGIFIRALDGAPGINSARWAGDDASTEEIMKYTLHKMRNKEDRAALFKTVIVLQSPEREKFFFEGLTEGRLAGSPKAEPKPGMPYTALFSPNGTDKVLAEMAIEEQKGVSSRGKAILQVVDFLKTALNS